ncbi:MAG: neutral/alkaline non-lysosomal ceramidase N-terminal domain-containing protein [Planctomycetes bacterium]|nr:neutral/alkaline non-lysosomal ceramidase N-terminal domain-containing protein [Planctomycetota bacterium]MBL7143397.1 neutral/alkaline non-lysosomal ceramidase N-terminal domain-containing protein [Phycisphaerae bacterium]
MNKSNYLIRYFLLFLVIINALPLLAKADSSSESRTDSKSIFRAGAAVSNITPPLDEPVVGGWNSPPATHVHDELYAKCLVLDDGKTKLVFVVCDNLGISREVYDKAKRIINEKTSIPIENMMMSATHTHSSITARSTNRLRQDKELSSYQQFLVSRISDGVRRAVNNLKPARIGWGSTQEPAQVFNRRCFMKPGVPVPNPFGGEDKVVMNPGRGNPNILKAAGLTDPQIAFLSIKSVDGRTIALLANYSLHYVGTGQQGVISADYFGVFADKIRQLLGADRSDPPFIGILTNGTSGDINNIDWLNKPTKGFAPYEKMQQVADLVATAVYEAHKNLKFQDWVKLDAMKNELALAVRKPTDKQIAYAQRILEKPDDAKPYHKHEKVYARRTLQMQDTPAEVSVVLQTFRIGNLGICAIPFEVFVEIGLEMKAKSPFEQTFTISHANGSYGYLPTIAQHELGGYETWLGTNMVEIQASAKIIHMLIGMFNRIR